MLQLVPEARFELARLSTTVFETAASAIPPLGRGRFIITHWAKRASNPGYIFYG